MTQRNNVLGAWGEEKTIEYLLAKDYLLLDRNWRRKLGEIDIVALAPIGIVAFVEVKTRSSHRFGHPLEAINHRKATRLELLARAWMRESPIAKRSFRLDFSAIVGDGLNLHEIDYRIGSIQ